MLTHRTLFPQNGGYPIVVYNTIRGLVQHGHKVTLLSLTDKPADDSRTVKDPLLTQIVCHTCHINNRVGAMSMFVSFFSKSASFIDRYFDDNAEKVLITELQKHHYDIVQFEGLFVTPYLATVKKHSKARTVYRAHNIEHIVWQRVAQQKADPFKKIYLLMLAKRIKEYETEQVARFDAIIAFTEQDRKELIQYTSNTPVKILPIGLDIAKYNPDALKTEFPSLFFLGSLGWMPNLEGIEWFMQHFHADLCEGDLRVRFYLAGNDIPEMFDDYEVPGKIYIQGEVDDALEFVNSKSIMIVPLLSGGGMRVKIVEGMAMKKCIISTSLGAEGIAHTHGQNIIIANTRQDFFSAIARCISDESYCRAIGDAGRQLVEQNHNIQAVTTQLEQYYQQVLKS